MEIEIKLKGCPYEDREEMQVFMHARDLASMICEAKQKIRTRLKHAEDVSEAEEKFLDELWEELTMTGL